jgi:hypothetical protein
MKHIAFPSPSRPVDKKIIKQLQRDFGGEGCLREELSNRVPAIIDNLTLEGLLNKLGYNAETLKNKSSEPPLLSLLDGLQLECLHEQHRILAAKACLPPSQRWWVVDLYRSGSFN